MRIKMGVHGRARALGVVHHWMSDPEKPVQGFAMDP